MAGGRAGEAYHRRVDRAGWHEQPVRERDETLREEHEADRERPAATA